MSRTGWMIVAAALVLAGLAAMVSVFVAGRIAARSDDWKQTAATVERVEGTKVEYRYDAGGTTHRAAGPARPGGLYAPGRVVVAYVNPANPAESLLDLPPRPPMWPNVAGTLSILFGAAIAAWFWRAANAKKKAVVRKPVRKPMSRLQPPPPVKWKRDDD
jgi:hypothetical protein